MVDLHRLSATQVLQLIREQSVSVEDVISNLLDRIKTVNDSINALVYYNEEEILSQAASTDKKISQGEKVGPLCGLPISIKDNIETRNLVTTGGIKGREGYTPTSDAPVVERLKKNGAIILGKTNCPAFCAGWETENEIYGRTNNPYNLNRTVGSSSGGEAALIASFGSYLGIGSDTGGSIRWPSSYCGIPSLVPTFGRVPRTGTIPPYLGFLDTTQIGPLARSVRDLSLILPLIMGPDDWDSRCVPMKYHDPASLSLENLKIAYYAENGFVEPEKEVRNAVFTSSELLANAGVDAEEQYPLSTSEYLELSKGLNRFTANLDAGTYPEGHELAEPVELYPTNILDLSDTWLKKSTEATGSKVMLGVEFFHWGMKLDAYRTKIMQFLKEFDAIICPVSAIPAFMHGEPKEESFNPQNLLSFTHPYCLVGLPAVTIRGGTSSDNLPIGIQIITKHAQEGLALKLALYLEEKLGEWDAPPF